MSKHLGNLTVTPENVHDFPAVDEIYGHLTLTGGVTLVAPRLIMVRGWVTILAGSSLTAARLGLIDGWVNIEGAITALHLAEIRHDLRVTETSLIDLPALSAVGSLNTQHGAAKNLIGLTEVRENVTLAGLATIKAPLLKRVGRSITLRENAVLDAPDLGHIGGYVDIDETAKIIAPRFVA